MKDNYMNKYYGKWYKKEQLQMTQVDTNTIPNVYS